MVLNYWTIKEQAISFSICRLRRAPPNTSRTYHPEDYSVTDLYVDEPLCAHTRVRACACRCECALHTSAATLIFELSLGLTRELVAVAGCESSVSTAICCHNIRVT